MSVDSAKFPRFRPSSRHDKARQKIEALLALADVELGGKRPWDLRVHNEAMFSRIIAQGSLGLGEAYMDGWWDCPKLDEFFDRVLWARLDERVKHWADAFHVLLAKFYNFQRPGRAFHIGRHHYDIGNDLYQRMLDKRMVYSCGYWKHASTLDEAQEAKLDLVCRKLNLQPGMHVLDVGCGWGGAARYMAEKYQVQVTGVTVSEEQAQLARDNCRGLKVEILLQDYRKIEGKFDRIFSIGMFEHVGYKNYRTYMGAVRRHLAEDGLFLLHTIGGNVPVTKPDLWIGRYIFPNSMLPSASQITQALEGLFVLEDWHSFGVDYDKTLMQWYRNFVSHWGALKANYGERFFRMWTYYLLSNAGSFRSRQAQLWQLVLSARGVRNGYASSR